MGEADLHALRSRGIPAVAGGTTPDAIDQRRAGVSADFDRIGSQTSTTLDRGNRELSTVEPKLSDDPRLTLRRSGAHSMMGSVVNAAENLVNSVRPTTKK